MINRMRGEDDEDDDGDGDDPNDDDDSNLYNLTEEVEDLMLAHLFDTRNSLILKVQTLSSDPDRLSQKDVERLVQIICDYSVKYHVLYADQHGAYHARQNYIQRRMRANLT